MFTLTQPPFCILYQCIVGPWNAITTVLYLGFQTPACNTVHRQQTAAVSGLQ